MYYKNKRDPYTSQRNVQNTIFFKSHKALHCFLYFHTKSDSKNTSIQIHIFLNTQILKTIRTTSKYMHPEIRSRLIRRHRKRRVIFHVYPLKIKQSLRNFPTYSRIITPFYQTNNHFKNKLETIRYPIRPGV